MLPERALLKRIEKELHSGNPAWKVIVLQNAWLCPYCGEVGADGLRMEDELERRISRHFLGGPAGAGGAAAPACPAFDDFNAEPLDRQALERRAALITIDRKARRALASDARWQIADSEGDWICPFCARPAGIAVAPPGEALGDVLDDARIARIAPPVSRHLAACEAYALGKGRERALDELKARKTKVEAKKRARRLQQLLIRDEAWRFRDMEKRWLCPFCALPTDVLFEKNEEPPLETCQRIQEHIDSCSAHRQLDGKPRTERYLKDRVIAINKELVIARLKRKLESHAIWQVTDADDSWYCPYCAKPTAVLLPGIHEGATVPETALNDVWAHLSSCPEYAGKGAQLRSRAYMKGIVAQFDRQIRVRREVRRAFAEDPRFSVQDPFGSWVCPYCRKVQKRIAFAGNPRGGSRGGLLEKTLEQVITHLLEQCPTYQEGAEPDSKIQELREIAAPEERPHRRASAADVPSALTASGSGSGSGEEDWIQKIDREVAALKSQVEVSVELKRSLEDARSRQLRLLPRLPEIPGFEFGIVYKPCSTVGGDFYDFIRANEDSLGVAIGDISGHGIEAALLVGLAKKLLEIHGRGRRSPGELLLLANADIFPDLDAKTFVTVFYGILDTKTRAFRFSRAGHNPLILYNPARTPQLQVLDSKGMALGMDPGPIFQQSIEEVEVHLVPGDLIFLYTDGVVESMNHEREEFGLERLYAMIEQFGRDETEYLLYQIEKAMQDFREGARQKNDVTMVAIKVL